MSCKWSLFEGESVSGDGLTHFLQRFDIVCWTACSAPVSFCGSIFTLVLGLLVLYEAEHVVVVQDLSACVENLLVKAG